MRSLKLKSFFRSRLNRFLLVSTLFFLLTGVVLFFQTQAETKKMLDTNAEGRKLVVSRGGAHAVESFFALVGKTLVVLSKQPQVESFTIGTQLLAEDFISSWSQDTPVRSVLFADSQGVVRYNINREGVSTTGVVVSDREYFIKTARLSEGEYYISQPFTARAGPIAGQLAITINTPIYREQQFVGIISTVLSLSELAQYFILPLYSAESTTGYILSQDGTVWYGQDESLIGQNIFTLIEQNAFPGSSLIADLTRKALTVVREGTLIQTIPNHETGRLEPHVVAYTPIHVLDQKWLLVIISPEHDSLLHFQTIRNIYFIRFIFFLFMIVFFIIMFNIGIRIAQRESYRRGFTEGHDHRSKN